MMRVRLPRGTRTEADMTDNKWLLLGPDQAQMLRRYLLVTHLGRKLTEEEEQTYGASYIKI